MYQRMLDEMAAQQGQTAGSPAASGKIAVSGVDKEEEQQDIKISKAKQKEYERMLIREARRRQAEKYGDEFIDDDDDD